MVIAGHSASLALLLSLAFGVAHTIRSLKDGPMIDAEGRQYKSAVLTTGENSGSDSSDETAVHVRCTETSMIITVKADLFKYGRLVSAGELFLGEGEHTESSQCQAVAVTDTELVIEAGLQDCGSKLTMSEDFVTYSNQLMFSPATSHHGVTRMIRAVVPVNCHYKRTHFVSSYPQQPLVLSASAKYSAFSLKLMTGDWRSEMSSTFETSCTLRLLTLVLMQNKDYSLTATLPL
uniref:zona pellucida sperm-binding protein 3-like n=1 Tax=Monopterus albus TaxID=43700 RepID=UPI0009B49AE4|nr:zona pellucida sperm-binding protein 3-like [Monopterus albus]